LQNLPDYPWLKELHSKIWNKNEEHLLRQVVVTHAHFTKLQKRLNDKHPDRNEREYDGSHDILSIKLGVLIPNTCEMDVDDLEESHRELLPSSLFPFTLRFLDLTPLHLENELPYMPSPLFIRQEYEEITNLIEHDSRYNKDSVVVSGQPGTGEVLVFFSHRI
jgi:hypothetical protein